MFFCLGKTINKRYIVIVSSYENLSLFAKGQICDVFLFRKSSLLRNLDLTFRTIYFLKPIALTYNVYLFGILIIILSCLKYYKISDLHIF